jgi:hypothetical protein
MGPTLEEIIGTSLIKASTDPGLIWGELKISCIEKAVAIKKTRPTILVGILAATRVEIFIVAVRSPRLPDGRA